MSEPDGTIARGAFKLRVAPLKIRLGIVERNETELAERTLNARGSSVFMAYCVVPGSSISSCNPAFGA